MTTYLNKSDVKVFVGQCIATSVNLLIKLSDIKESGVDIKSDKVYQNTYTELTMINRILISLDEYTHFEWNK